MEMRISSWSRGAVVGVVHAANPRMNSKPARRRNERRGDIVQRVSTSRARRLSLGWRRVQAEGGAEEILEGDVFPRGEFVGPAEGGAPSREKRAPVVRLQA